MSNKKNTFISDLHLVCAKNESRPAMSCIHFKNGYAYASDSYSLVKQPIHFNPILNADILDGVAIHAESFRAIRRMRTVIATEDGFECTSKDGSKAFFEYAKDVDAPDFEAVLNRDKAEAVSEIGVMPVRIGVLHKAMAGGMHTKMSFHGAGNAIIIKPADIQYEGEIAMVMPTMIHE